MTTILARRGPALALGVVLAALGLAAPAARGQSGGPYDLTWSTIDGGGTTAATGGAYALGGTAGQPDAGLATGGAYALEGGFWHGGLLLTPVAEDLAPGEGAVPLANRLHDVAPNPFNPRVVIAFDLARPADVRLAVYDLRGRRVRTLAAGPLPAGAHAARWDGTDDSGAALPSGLYVCRMTAATGTVSRKMMLAR